MTQTHDTSGRPYAKLSELRTGDCIELDESFDCHSPGIAIVFETKPGIRLYFVCKYGFHFIDGQADDGEHCIGIYGPLP